MIFVKILPPGVFFAGLAFLVAPGLAESGRTSPGAAQVAQATNTQAIVNAEVNAQTAQNSKKISSAAQKIEKQSKFLLTSAIASGIAGAFLLKTQCCPSKTGCPTAGGGGG